MDAVEPPRRLPGEDHVPPRVSTLGVPRRDEHRDALIIALGILLAVLALAATVGYAVYHALTTRDRPTIGMTGVAAVLAPTPAMGAASVRTGDR